MNLCVPFQKELPLWDSFRPCFLAMMASCLMFKILSGATKDIGRYEMLRKMGVRKELLIKSMYKELGIVFLFPAILGLIHVLVGMNVFTFVKFL